MAAKLAAICFLLLFLETDEYQVFGAIAISIDINIV